MTLDEKLYCCGWYDAFKVQHPSCFANFIVEIPTLSTGSKRASESFLVIPELEGLSDEVEAVDIRCSDSSSTAAF